MTPSTPTFDFPATLTLTPRARAALIECIRRCSEDGECDFSFDWTKEENGQAPAVYAFTAPWEWYSEDEDRWVETPIPIRIDERDLVGTIQRRVNTPPRRSVGVCPATVDAIDQMVSRLYAQAGHRGPSSAWSVILEIAGAA